MRACFTSKNLIGDSLGIAPALRAWHRQHADWEIDLLTLPDYIAQVYTRFGVPLNVITDESKLNKPYDFEHNFNINEAFTIGDQKKVHIAEAYARALFGEELPEDLEQGNCYEPEEEEHASGLILFSPFSRSCSSNQGKPANKMLSWPVWLQILTLMRSYGEIGVLGGTGDRLPLPIADNEYYTGLPLNTVALMLRDAKVIVTIDNGMSHLAASQKAPTVLFYPACLGMHWVSPVGNPNAFVIQVDPAKIVPAQGVFGVRNALRALADMGAFKP